MLIMLIFDFMEITISHFFGQIGRISCRFLGGFFADWGLIRGPRHEKCTPRVLARTQKISTRYACVVLW